MLSCYCFLSFQFDVQSFSVILNGVHQHGIEGSVFPL